MFKMPAFFLFIHVYILIRACSICVLADDQHAKTLETVPAAGNIPPAVNHSSHESIASSKNGTISKHLVPPHKPSSSNSGAKKRLDPVSSTTPKHNISSTEPREKGMVVLDNASFQRINSGALLRGFYVFVGLSVIVVMYLVVRSIRLRRKVSRVHKYGILTNREDVEMTPLGAEDEDDDTIVFDLSNHPPS